MKLLISIVSYLLKDIFWRWREQPGNVLTRFTVAYALVLPSLALLGAFVLMANNLEARLKRNGIDMLFITEHVPSTSEDIASRQQHPRMAPLARHGTMFQLLQLFSSGKNPYAQTVRAAAYPDASLPALWGMVTPEQPVAYLSDTLPEGMQIRTEIDDHFFMAQVRRPSDMLEKLFQSDVVLLPEGMLPRVESKGFSRVTIFRVNHLAMIEPLQKALRLTTEMDHTNVFIRSSLKLLNDFNSLKARQLRWRFGLAVAAGGVLALVLGTLAVLEYQQRAYVIALLRSFGIKRSIVYIMQLLENGLVVNLAGVAAYFTWSLVQNALYRAFNSGNPPGALTMEQMLAELALIFACINLGVVLSTIPSMHVLKQDIGTILS
jgi:hypothetical protein